MRWTNWDALCARLRSDPATPWYAYAVGTEAPDAPLHADAFGPLLDEIDALLRRDHDEEYLGIAYVDDMAAPTLVKIYDPNQLGAAGLGAQRRPSDRHRHRISPARRSAALVG